MKDLSAKDNVGMSYWVISVSLLAVSIFLLFQSIGMEQDKKTSTLIAASVTIIAATHYFYMRDYWIKNKKNPIVFRYIDWIITVPLQLIELYYILNTDLGSDIVKPEIAFKLFIPGVLMIVFGFLAETGIMNRNLGGVISMVFWIYILYEIFFGSIKDLIDKSSQKAKDSLNILKWIIFVGWSLYPIGFYIKDQNVMNGLYNMGDFVNKILFVLVVFNYNQS